jgi:serine/threonine-protein kinase
MALEAGTKLGPYEILSPLGAGGMGEVYKAKDTRLDRMQPYGFSPDEKQLLYREVHPQRGGDLLLRSLDGDGSSLPLLVTEFNKRNAEISPDGRWLAYGSDASGQYEIYARPFPNANEGLEQVSRGGGNHPLWARDGSELFYLDPGGRLLAVPVRLDPSFNFGNPEIVFEESYYASTGRTYDVHPDGERFLMIKEGGAGDESAAELILVQN